MSIEEIPLPDPAEIRLRITTLNKDAIFEPHGYDDALIGWVAGSAGNPVVAVYDARVCRLIAGTLGASTVSVKGMFGPRRYDSQSMNDPIYLEYGR